MTDDIKLPPLPDPMWPEYGLSRAYSDAYSERQMQDFARAAILADRERRVSAEPVAWGVLDSTDESLHGHGWVYIAGTRDEANQHINDALMEPNLVDVARVWVARPLYTAPPPTPPADAQITDDMVERACIAFSEASGFDETRRGAKVRSVAIAAALRAALKEEK
jgi:hypothetical protein